MIETVPLDCYLLLVTHAYTAAWVYWKLRGRSEEKEKRQENSQG